MFPQAVESATAEEPPSFAEPHNTAFPSSSQVLPDSSASRVSRTSHVFTLRAGEQRRRLGYRTDSQRYSVETDKPFDPDLSLPDADSTASGDTLEQVPLTDPPPPVQKMKRIQSNTTSVGWVLLIVLVTDKRVFQTKLKEWLSFRQTCLDELLRHDGRGDYLKGHNCATCQEGEGVFKCLDCFDGGLLRCKACLVAAHHIHPLHRVKEWNGSFFSKTSLHSLGLKIQLGHGEGKCPSLADALIFCVFDTSGVHKVNVKFCDCGKNGFVARRIQLLRVGWFPATFNRPKTVFTFTCLDLYYELSLQGKTTIYDFYHTILRRTDNLGLERQTYRYAEFHRVVRIWCGLLMLKRAGRGQEPAGAAATAHGELALECPACPHPGRNLPKNWDIPGPLAFLYTLFLAIDANFKLKQKNRGINDPELSPGWAYFVEEGPYQDFIKDYVDQSEINTCQSEHDAIVRATVRSTPGYAVTGTIIVICPRHGLVRKNGAGDLQKGERYCNVDFVVLMALIGIQLLRIVITYDIVCQWSRNFLHRMKEFPEHMWLKPGTQIDVGVPSWHINGHGADCRANYCLGYMDGVGRTCGEEIESSWSQTNALGTSTREMGPGARHETLNDQWGGYNFRKIVGFRKCVRFLKRLREACDMRNKHSEIFKKFSETFSESMREKWEKMLADWNVDPSKPNPYEEPVAPTSLQDVRLELGKEDMAMAADGHGPSIKTTLGSFFMTGLDIEEQQRQICLEAAEMKKSPTSKQQADLDDKRTSLLRRIHRWHEVQLVYIPCVGGLLAASLSAAAAGESLPELAESIPLYLPSSLPYHLRCLPEMVLLADDALADVRRQRRIISGLWQFKRLNVNGTGNKSNTRMRTLYNCFNLRTQRCADCYRAARQRLVVLDPNGSWCGRLQVLKDEDIRGPGQEDNKKSKGRFEPSWIWLVPRVSSAPDVGDTEEHLDENMRVEWMKSKARMQRWEEEVMLTTEEMRRVISYFEWKASWWRTQGPQRTGLDVDVEEGVTAYAAKQAYLSERMAESCGAHWVPFLLEQGAPLDWTLKYVNAQALGDAEEVEDEEEEEEEEIDDEMASSDGIVLEGGSDG
ncbi:hypothetical protein JOM56_005734 [Amanita muscaria]